MKNVRLSSIEITALAAEARPAILPKHLDGADFFPIRTSRTAPVLEMHDSKDLDILPVRDGRTEPGVEGGSSPPQPRQGLDRGWTGAGQGLNRGFPWRKPVMTLWHFRC